MNIILKKSPFSLLQLTMLLSKGILRPIHQFSRSLTSSQPLVPQASTSVLSSIDASFARPNPLLIPAPKRPPGGSRGVPYYLQRTAKSNALPVFSKLRKGTHREIIIRHCFGDLEVRSSEFHVLFPEYSLYLRNAYYPSRTGPRKCSLSRISIGKDKEGDACPSKEEQQLYRHQRLMPAQCTRGKGMA